MRNSDSIEIDCPIEHVFKCANEDIPEWSIVVVDDEIIEKKNDGGVGTTFRTVTEDRGAKMEFEGEVTLYDPPFHNAVRLIGPSFDIETEFLFKDLGGRTQVTQNSEVRGKGVFRVFLGCCGWLMKRSSCDAQQRELESLKQYCEKTLGNDSARG